MIGKRFLKCTAWWFLCALFFGLAFPCEAQVIRARRSAPTGDGVGDFAPDPDARALYDEMMQTMDGAETLSWVSEYEWESGGKSLGRFRYEILLKKPNFVRMEVTNLESGRKDGVLIGDGDNFWIHWPSGKHRFTWERSGELAKIYEKHRKTFYVKKPAPPGFHSISHETNLLGAGMGMTILDPSTFHGCTDALYFHIDGVRFLEDEAVDGEACRVIEVRMMNHQRIRTLWLSRKDNLPRRLKERVRAAEDVITRERWSAVEMNEEMEDGLFTWSPPEGWVPWHRPEVEEGFLPPGTMAPDFDLAASTGDRIRLSALRGKVVYLYVWKSG